VDVFKRATIRKGRLPSNSASKRAPSSIARSGSAAPRPTRNESSPAIVTHSSSSLVLPRPALPSTTTTHPVPARTWLSLRRMTASSRSRPRRGGRGEASIFRTVHQGLTGTPDVSGRRPGRPDPLQDRQRTGDRALTRDTIAWKTDGARPGWVFGEIDELGGDTPVGPSAGTCCS